MSKVGKVIIILAVSFLIFVIGVIAAAVYWWTHYSREIIEAGQRVYQEGEQLGKKSDEQVCLDEAISRYKANRGITGSISTGIFLRICLDASRPTPGFCDQVPKPTDIFKSSQWQIEQCKKAGISDSYCGTLFSQVQQYCQAKAARPKPDSPDEKK
jgi:hypothetical protein